MNSYDGFTHPWRGCSAEICHKREENRDRDLDSVDLSRFFSALSYFNLVGGLGRVTAPYDAMAARPKDRIAAYVP